MRLLQLITITAALVFASQAHADRAPAYFSFEVGGMSADHELLPEFSPAFAAIGLGYGFGRFLSIEARAGLSGSDTAEMSGVEIDGNIDNFVSGFVRLALPDFPSERVVPYLLAGYSRVEATAELLGTSESETEDGVSYGAGIALYGLGNTGVKFEYTQYLDTDALDLSAWSLGIVHHF